MTKLIIIKLYDDFLFTTNQWIIIPYYLKTHATLSSAKELKHLLLKLTSSDAISFFREIDASREMVRRWGV